MQTEDQKKVVEFIISKQFKPIYEKNFGRFWEEDYEKASKNPLEFCVEHKMEYFIPEFIENGGLDPNLLSGQIYKLAFDRKEIELLEYLFAKGLELEVPDQYKIIPFEKLCKDLKDKTNHRYGNLENLKALSMIIEKQEIPKEHLDDFLIIVLDQIYLWYTKQRGEAEYDGAINWILRRGVSQKKLKKSRSWGIVYKYYSQIEKEKEKLLF